MITFQEMLRRLGSYWEAQGCITHQGYDLEVGAGTSNPATFLRCLGPEPYKAFYIEPCRRPGDSRYGENPARNQHYFQGQVILKPSPDNVIDLYLKSLEAIGIDLTQHDIRFVHDDWENPTLGAWGLGWEVWMDGMEVTQFTYFQSVGGQVLKPITAEITYGLERLCMYLQKVNSIMEIQWNEELTYRDIYWASEVEFSHYNLEQADTGMWFRMFDDFEREATKLMELGLPLPAYDFVLKTSHAFNLLDARGAISVTERAGYIGRIRDLSRKIAESYIKSREALNYPLLGKFKCGSHAPEPAQIKVEPSTLNFDGIETFVLEIGSEELPATFVPIGCRNLERGITQLFQEASIPFRSIKVMGTPRRLSVLVDGVPLAKPAKQVEKKGPAVASAFSESGTPTKAAEGFFRSIQKSPLTLEEISKGIDPSLEIRELGGVKYLYALLTEPAKPTREILSEKLPEMILKIEFPKKMRWGDGEISYARPIRWIVALLGKEVIPFIVGNVAAGRESQGHRQLCNIPFTIENGADYRAVLKKHFVVVEMEERERVILEQIEKLEKEIQGSIINREEVIPEVLYLTEWPLLTPMTFDNNFLRAPKEVLISEMVKHQRYFPVAAKDGTLRNLFVITANVTPTDKIREGNLKVLSARLSDGVFLYEQGLKRTLDVMNEKLKQMTHQKELGSVWNKVERVVAHAESLQNLLKIGNADKAKRAAMLCKADLASEMVYEFPELQGTIGKYYARAQGEEEEVATAIEEHWMPLGESSPLPSTPTGIIVSLADKYDNLIGCFSVGLKPTSSSDPYALRRQALALIRIIINGKYSLPLKESFEACAKHYPEKIREGAARAVGEILEFLTNRIKTVFLDYGFSKDEIEAAVAMGFSDIFDAFRKVEALHRFRGEKKEQFARLFEVYKRAKGQLAQGEAGTLDQELLKEEAEKELYQTLKQMEKSFAEAVQYKRYDEAYDMVANIQPSLSRLFEDVKILDDDEKVRKNRLALLKGVFGLFDQLLDFSKIVEDKHG